MPLLRDVDAVAFSDRVIRRVRACTARLVEVLGGAPDDVLPLARPIMLLGDRLVDLVRYAQHGHTDPSTAVLTLDQLEEALYRRAIDETFGSPPVSASDLLDEIGLVRAAARARLRLAHREDVPVLELAALTDCAKSTLHAALRKEQLRRAGSRADVNQPVVYVDALRWALEHEVEGLVV